MGEPAPREVDVRDMVCAQALAVVAQALARGASDEALVVRYNAEDVRQDVEAWARTQQYSVRAEDAGVLRLTRR